MSQSGGAESAALLSPSWDAWANASERTAARTEFRFGPLLALPIIDLPKSARDRRSTSAQLSQPHHLQTAQELREPVALGCGYPLLVRRRPQNKA